MSDYANDDRSEQLDQDQLQPQYSLNDRGVEDALDEGYSPPERPSALLRHGEHESLDERQERGARADARIQAAGS